MTMQNLAADILGTEYKINQVNMQFIGAEAAYQSYTITNINWMFDIAGNLKFNYDITTTLINQA